MVFTLILHNITAQRSITGGVVDEQNAPVPYANVILLKVRDTTMITGTITTEEGRFELINSSNEPVLVQVMLIGYKDFFKKTKETPIKIEV